MANSKIKLQLKSSATYRIRVQGCLEDIWSDRLANMAITMDIKEGEANISTLLGKVKDQAELIGVINGLYELRMPLLSLEMIDLE